MPTNWFNKYRLPLSIALIVSISSLQSCVKEKAVELTTAPSGLRYHFFHTESTGKTGSVGDVYALNMVIRNIRDSVLLDRQLLFERFKPIYPGDFHEALSYLHVGDSALFQLAADSFFTHHGMNLPKGVNPGEDVKLYLGCDRIMNPIENAIYMNEEELKKINAFIERKNWELQTDSTGIKWERLTASVPAGPAIEIGDSVEISYLYYTLEEKIIQQSKQGDYWKFMVGDQRRIAGLTRALTLMKGGEKIRAIIPYALAFGEGGMPPMIPPFTTIVLEIEVHNVIKQ